MSQKQGISRLMGLETEYAIRFHGPQGRSVSQVKIYRAILKKFRARLPLCSGSSLEEKHFTANGGTIGFERVNHAGGFGLIECATPECRSPRELITWQRAQDRLLMQCTEQYAEQPGSLGTVALVKNSRDSQGNVYGTHENYSIRVGPIAIWFLRIVVILASSMSILAWVFLIPAIFLFVLMYWGFAGLIYLAVRSRFKPSDKQRLYRNLFGDGFTEDEDLMPIPRWLESRLNNFVMLSCWPGLRLICFTAKHCVYRQHVRAIAPFLATRSIFSGSGWLDSKGRFWLAQKATAIKSFVGPMNHDDYPLFSIAHFLDTCLVGWFNPIELMCLLGRDHRIQVCLGDSNMADEAEYLRVGTTWLLVDAIESGFIGSVPKLDREAVLTIGIVAGDESMDYPVAKWNGKSLNAIEVQQWYLDVCRRFVQQTDDAPDDAYEVLQRWSDTLDALKVDPDSLIGNIDWVTKRWLLKHAGNDLPLDANRKIDIKYHELSQSGYFSLMCETDDAESLISEEAIEKAMRSPPSTPKARRRAQFIREFAGGSEPVRVSWNSVRIGKIFRRKKIRL